MSNVYLLIWRDRAYSENVDVARECRAKKLYRVPVTPKRTSVHTRDHVVKIRERRRRWLAAAGKANMEFPSFRYLFVCEDHFVTKKPADLSDEEHIDWVPSVNLPTPTGSQESRSSEETIPQVEQAESPQQEVSVEEPQGGRDEEPQEEIIEEAIDPNSVGVQVSVDCNCEECQTDMTSGDIEAMEEKLKSTHKEIQDLYSLAVRPKLTESDFANDIVKSRYFTGLSSASLLTCVFQLVSPHLHLSDDPHMPQRILTKFESFMLTLMRLRLNLDVTFLAYFFGVSRRSASRTFNECLGVLYNVLHNFISWPERGILHTNMAKLFQESFGNKVTAIIDCFEIRTERPSNLLARAQTWSNYKHHNTVKYLIGITPYGVISFISDAFGGRVSDKYITEHCGFLDKLCPGDLILADRGFTVADSVALVCAEIRVPAFTRGKSQLSAVEVEKTREIAHVRIHVERVIGSLRQKYTILSGTLLIHMLIQQDGGVAVIDKIVAVCCALTNLCPSVIPLE